MQDLLDPPKKLWCILVQNPPAKAMDTDEGQRTTARLLEEARHLWEVTTEPVYTIVEEAVTTTTGKSEAIISDILSTRDP